MQPEETSTRNGATVSPELLLAILKDREPPRPRFWDIGAFVALLGVIIAGVTLIISAQGIIASVRGDAFDDGLMLGGKVREVESQIALVSVTLLDLQGELSELDQSLEAQLKELAALPNRIEALESRATASLEAIFQTQSEAAVLSSELNSSVTSALQQIQSYENVWDQLKIEGFNPLQSDPLINDAPFGVLPSQ